MFHGASAVAAGRRSTNFAAVLALSVVSGCLAVGEPLHDVDTASASRRARIDADTLPPLTDADAPTTARINELLDEWLARRATRLRDKESVCWEKAAFALVALHRNRSDYFARAEGYIADIATEYAWAGAAEVENFQCYWAAQIVWRIAADSNIRQRLSPEAKLRLFGMIWNYVRDGSTRASGLENAAVVRGSGNHNFHQRAVWFLGVQILVDHYGMATSTMGDGYTVQQHYDAHLDHWQRLIRSRAREGVFAEVNSVGYDKYSLAALYNVADFAKSPSLRRLARSFVALHWADAAQTFLPSTGVRGGASTRVYKGLGMTRAIYQGMAPLYYAYGWTDRKQGPHFQTLPMLCSPYRVPSIVTAQATATRAPFRYTVRRPGRGTSIADGWRLAFLKGGSSLRQDSYVSPSYVMGTMTWHPSREYTGMSNQNRLMGVYFDSHPDARIQVHGKGTNPGTNDVPENCQVYESCIVGYNEINGMLGTNAMVIAMDINRHDNSGMRIYMPYAGDVWGNSTARTLWKNGESPAGRWIFTYSGSSYVAFRLARSGYVVQSVVHPNGQDPAGKMLELQDPWSPIVFQLGEAADFASFDDFKVKVRATTFWFSHRRREYTFRSLNGDTFRFRARSSTLPTINGQVPSLNPPRAYDGPWMQGMYGSGRVVLYDPRPGHPDYVLTFD